MKTRTYYVAEDGTQFETKEECQNYEASIHFDCAIFLNSDYDIIKIDSKHLSNANYAKYIYIRDKDQFRKLCIYIHNSDAYFEINFDTLLISQLESGDVIEKVTQGQWFNLTRRHEYYRKSLFDVVSKCITEVKNSDYIRSLSSCLFVPPEDDLK